MQQKYSMSRMIKPCRKFNLNKRIRYS